MLSAIGLSNDSILCYREQLVDLIVSIDKALLILSLVCLVMQRILAAAVGLQEAMPHSLTPTTTSSADLSSALALDNIRQTLIRQEDTIIFLLIERAQFARNAAVYEADAVPVPDYDSAGKRYSLLEYLLRETEQIHGKIRRYTSPDEQAFYPDCVPPLVLPPIQYEEVRFIPMLAVI